MIYLDHNATSPLLPEVRRAMEPWFGVPANPSSVHRPGRAAAAAVERAREQVAALVGGVPAGVVFTSGATEANHTFLRGAAALRPGGIALSAQEHPSVRAAAEATGQPLRWLPVDKSGVVVLEPCDAPVVSLMAVNHETGVLQPVEQARARYPHALLHVDATQAAGRLSLSFGLVDGVVLSAHKLGGPAGVGALVLRSGGGFPPLLAGGAQERGRRAGTVNTAGVVGFGAACELAGSELRERQQRWSSAAEVLRAGLVALGGRLVGGPTVPSTTCVVFPGVPGEALVQALDLQGVCVSAGAACASGSHEPSPTLLALGDPEPLGAVRISLGPRSVVDDVQGALRVLAGVLPGVRAAAALERDLG